jgi:hypothetical protein
MTAAREAVLLPVAFLTVALAGGFDPGAVFVWTPPSVFSLVLAVMLVGALIRSGTLAPDRLLHSARPILANANGALLLVTLFAASAQLVNMLTPRSGLPLLLVGSTLFLLVVNTLVMSPDRVRLLRSLGVVIGSAFLLKFVVLAALADPEGSRTKRVLVALFDAATLGTISQSPVQPVAGYIAFFMCLLYLMAVVMLPGEIRRQETGVSRQKVDVEMQIDDGEQTQRRIE